MFTGDSKENALSISEKLNIDKVYYELLPTEKYEKLEELLNDKDVVAFIGDGIMMLHLLKEQILEYLWDLLVHHQRLKQVILLLWMMI